MLQEPARMNLVRRDEKEAKLKDFIERFLTARRSAAALDDGLAEDPAPCRVVARSADSPVARVLLGLLPEFSAQAVAIKALYAMPGSEQPILGPPSVWVPPRIECRRAGDMRLLEAHELLILGPHTAWVGDCMRREPSQVDAYEFYADDCSDMAAAALRSFERLWALAKPCRPRVVTSNPMPLPPLAGVQGPHDLTMPISFSRH